MKIEEDFVRRDVDGLALHSNALMIHARAGRRWLVLLRPARLFVSFLGSRRPSRICVGLWPTVSLRVRRV